MEKCKSILLFLTLLFSTNLFAIQEACDDYEKISNLMTPYLKQAWPGVAVTPSGPVPTLTYFTLSARQPISDFCRFISTLRSLDTLGQVKSSADYLNKLTNDQFKERTDFLFETYGVGSDVANYLGSSDKDKRNNMAIHRRINRYLATQDEFFTEEGEDRTFERRSARESKMTRMIKNANRLSVIDKLMRCPSGDLEPSEEEIEYYEKNIQPLYELIDEADDELSYYLSQLQRMGTKISEGYKEFREYQKDLYSVFNFSIFLTRGPAKSITVKTHRTGEKGSLKRQYYEYSVRSDPTKYKYFLKKYLEKWNDYVTVRALNHPEHLNNPRSQVNNDFRDLMHECRRSKIEWQLRKSDPRFRYAQRGNGDFITKVDQRIESCKEGIKINGKVITNIMKVYVSQLRSFLVRKQGYLAKLYSYESKERGVHRSVSIDSISTDVGDISTEKVHCEKQLSQGEQERVKIELQQNSLESREMMAHEMARKTQLIKLEEEEERRRREESYKRKQIEKESNSRRSKELKIGLPDTGAGFF